MGLELEAMRNGKSIFENKDWSDVIAKPIVVKDDAWIGMNYIVLKGVTIGEGAIVGAGALLLETQRWW